MNVHCQTPQQLPCPMSSRASLSTTKMFLSARTFLTSGCMSFLILEPFLADLQLSHPVNPKLGPLNMIATPFNERHDATLLSQHLQSHRKTCIQLWRMPCFCSLLNTLHRRPRTAPSLNHLRLLVVFSHYPQPPSWFEVFAGWTERSFDPFGSIGLLGSLNCKSCLHFW